jgi:serine/threonine-protein kinase
VNINVIIYVISFSPFLVVDIVLRILRTAQYRHQVLTYLFEGEEGQKLFTNISGTGILITVLAPNGEPLDARAARVSGWNGTLAYTGSYQIQLKSTATGNEPQSATGAETKFVLSVLLNQDFPRVIDVPPQ